MGLASATVLAAGGAEPRLIGHGLGQWRAAAPAEAAAEHNTAP